MPDLHTLGLVLIVLAAVGWLVWAAVQVARRRADPIVHIGATEEQPAVDYVEPHPLDTSAPLFTPDLAEASLFDELMGHREHDFAVSVAEGRSWAWTDATGSWGVVESGVAL